MGTWWTGSVPWHDAAAAAAMGAVWAASSFAAAATSAQPEGIGLSFARGLLAVVIVGLRRAAPDLALLAAVGPFAVLADPTSPGTPSPATQLVPVLVAAHAAASRSRLLHPIVVLAAATAAGVAVVDRTTFRQLVSGTDGDSLSTYAFSTQLGTTYLIPCLGLVATAVLLGDTRRRLVLAAVRSGEWNRRSRQLLRRSMVRERRFVAHELHDVVAHHMAAVVVRARVAERAPSTDPREAAAALRWIAKTGQDALVAVDDMVRGLESTEPPRYTLSNPGRTSLEAVLRLLLQRVQEAGVEVHDRLSLVDGPSDPRTDLATTRIVQEALTNALIHSDAGSAWVHVRDRHGSRHVVVHDDGSVPPPRTPTPGNGLTGMARRARELGGQVSVTTGPRGGWAVSAVLPLRLDRRPESSPCTPALSRRRTREGQPWRRTA